MRLLSMEPGLIKLFTSVSAQPISFSLSPPHFQVSEDAPETLFFSSKCYISYEATKRWIIHFFTNMEFYVKRQYRCLIKGTKR